MLEKFKNAISKVNRCISRPEGTEERISDPEDRLKEIIHTGKKKKERNLNWDTRRKRIKRNLITVSKIHVYRQRKRCIERERRQTDTDLTGTFKGIGLCDCGNLGWRSMEDLKLGVQRQPADRIPSLGRPVFVLKALNWLSEAHSHYGE